MQRRTKAIVARMSFKKTATRLGVTTALMAGSMELLRHNAVGHETEVERRQWFQGWAKDMVMPMFERAGTNIVGLDNIPKNGPYILTPKHTYGTDPFTAAHTAFMHDWDLEPVVLAKHQIENWPIVADLIYGTAIYVNRVPGSNQTLESRDEEVFRIMDKLATETVEVGGNKGATIIHPEGTRERRGVLPVKKGPFIAAALMSQKTGAPVAIVPIGIANNSPVRYLKGIISGRFKQKIEVTVGEAVWVDHTILGLFYGIKDPFTGEIWRDKHPEIQQKMEELRAKILETTNESRARCGMEPLAFIDTPSNTRRARRIGAKALQR